jgi:hypothetical protein
MIFAIPLTAESDDRYAPKLALSRVAESDELHEAPSNRTKIGEGG